MMTQKTTVSRDTTPTKTLLEGVVALTMVASVGLAGPATAAPEVVTISAIELSGTDSAQELTIRGSRAPTFSVFRGKNGAHVTQYSDDGQKIAA
jgi:hypothetical protein